MQALEFLRDEVMIRVTTYRNWTIFPELTQCAFCEVFDALEQVQVTGKLARLETISGDPDQSMYSRRTPTFRRSEFDFIHERKTDFRFGRILSWLGL